jgi:hypothetical protein
MTYNFKRALGIGFCLYIATLVVGLLCGMLVDKEGVSLTEMPDAYWYLSMAAAVILTYLFAGWYFKNAAIVPSAKSGFLFGFTAIALALLLDFAFFSLGNASDDPKMHVDIGDYYSDYRLWVVVALVIVTAKLVGHMKRRTA